MHVHYSGMAQTPPVSEHEAQASRACRESSRSILKTSTYHESIVPLLKMAIQQCIDTLCEVETYEWIDLNIAGLFRRLAQHGLDEIVKEHDYFHGHLDEVPPLAAEQATLDSVVSFTHDSRRFYDMAKQCRGPNEDIVIEKASELERDVVAKIEEVRVEIGELKRRRSKSDERVQEERRERERAAHAAKLDEAFCPAQVMDIPGAAAMHDHQGLPLM